MMRRLRMVCASGCLTSSVRLSLERLVHTKWEANPRTRSSYPRAKSPTPGRSTLMTRAPRSASWRVANGAAIACSSVTTVMPVSGLIGFSRSSDLCGGVHGEPALVVLGPQPHALAILRRLAAYIEGIDVEQRAHRAKFITPHNGVRPLRA